MQIELIEDRHALPLDRQEWNALVARSETNTVFQTFEWFDSWWRVMGPECRLYFLLARDERGIVGFAPFMISARTHPRQLAFVGNGNADYLDIVAPADRKQEMLAAICAFLACQTHRWSHIRLGNVPEASSTVGHFRAATRAHGMYLLEETRLACPTLRLKDGVPGARQLIDKQSVRRPLNWFRRRGAVTFRSIDTAADIEKSLPLFFEQHAARWMGTRTRSLFESAKQRELFRQLALRLHEAGWLAFTTVELDGEPIAFHFGFDYGNRIVWYKPSFDVRFGAHSPGLVLIRSLIEDGLARGREELDFTIGDEAFKERFTNHKRWNMYVRVYHSRRSYLPAAIEKGARRVASTVLGVVMSLVRIGAHRRAIA